MKYLLFNKNNKQKIRIQLKQGLINKPVFDVVLTFYKQKIINIKLQFISPKKPKQLNLNEIDVDLNRGIKNAI